MDAAAFAHMAAAEAEHWWFVGRRTVISALIDSAQLPPSGAILEAGCGTGGNLAVLSRRGTIAAFEPHIDALAFARARHPGVEILQGELPSRLPFELGSFDLVAALDVLEHVEDDMGSAKALVGLARPGGSIIVTVPAHQALWGSHDRRLHHVRRYGRAQLLSLFEALDVDLVRVTAFNTLLAPIAVTYRVAEVALRTDLGNQERLPAAPLNAMLTSIFSSEAALIRRGWNFRSGLSYAALFKRRSAS
jgi:SAM-dependent methyltransferase